MQKFKARDRITHVTARLYPLPIAVVLNCQTHDVLSWKQSVRHSLRPTRYVISNVVGCCLIFNFINALFILFSNVLLLILVVICVQKFILFYVFLIVICYY